MYDEIKDLFNNSAKSFKDLRNAFHKYRETNDSKAFEIILAASYEMVNKALARYNPSVIRNLQSYEVYDVVIDSIMEASFLLELNCVDIYKDYCRLLWTVLRNKLLNLRRAYFADKRNAIVDDNHYEELDAVANISDNKDTAFQEKFVDDLTQGETVIYNYMVKNPKVFGKLVEKEEHTVFLVMNGLNVLDYRTFVLKALRYVK